MKTEKTGMDLQEACIVILAIRDQINELKEREEKLKVLIQNLLENEDGPYEELGHRFSLSSRQRLLYWDIENLQLILPAEKLRDIAKVTFKEADMKKLAKTEGVKWDEVCQNKVIAQPELTLSIRKLAEKPIVFGKLEKKQNGK